MPWKRNDPDPLEPRRRQLAEQERQLAEQRERLREMLHGNGESIPAKRAEPPVWRMEEELHPRAGDPASSRKRDLARQRRRDRLLFFLFIAILLILGLVLWLAYVHSTTAPASA
jgi:hypothetical protein